MHSAFPAPNKCSMCAELFTRRGKFLDFQPSEQALQLIYVDSRPRLSIGLCGDSRPRLSIGLCGDSRPRLSGQQNSTYSKVLQQTP
jgi:hypothetical protein